MKKNLSSISLTVGRKRGGHAAVVDIIGKQKFEAGIEAMDVQSVLD